MEILKKDYLKITEYVRISPYLDMEMRGNCVMVYYRGGKILTIIKITVHRGAERRATARRTRGCRARRSRSAGGSRAGSNSAEGRCSPPDNRPAAPCCSALSGRTHAG